MTVISKLAVKYFIHNRKKTMVAVIILSLTLSIIVSSNLLINGYEQEINSLTGSGLRFDSEIDIVLTPNDNSHHFASDHFKELNEYLQSEENIDEFYLNFIDLINMEQEDNLNVFEVKISNINSLVQDDRIDLRSGLPSNASILVKEDISSQIIFYNDYKFVNSNSSIAFKPSDLGQFSTEGNLKSDILIDANSTRLPEQLRNVWNQIEISVGSSAHTEDIIESLEEFDFIEVSHKRADVIFVELSVNQIVQIMNILQSILGVLLVLSINYIMVSLVNESREDIKIFNMIGLNKTHLFMIFNIQTIIISFLAYFIGFVLSMIFVSLLAVSSAVVTNLPYLTFTPNISEQVFILVWTFAIGFISGIIPSFMAVTGE